KVSDPQGDAWLSPISADEGAPRGKRKRKGKKGRAHRPAEGTPERRASWNGFLSMRLDDYLQLLDWTGRQVRRDKRGSIPKDLAPILERLKVDADWWVDSVEHFEHWFHRAAGRAEHLKQAATAAGKRWFQGIAHSRDAFG
ncbi:MAG: hypothetical protein GY851_21340, partial [bacterium]|nr:hypothetical protein [bacterium]